MWSCLERPRLHTLSLIVLVLSNTGLGQNESQAPTSSHVARYTTIASGPEPTCEFRTVNYITHTLPQQCLTTSPTPAPTTEPTAATSTASIAADTTSQASSDGGEAQHDEIDGDGNDLSTGAFMSFEEWKAMMLAKASQGDAEAKPRRNKDGREPYPGEGIDTLGDEGEINLDFEPYSDRISEITSSARPSREDKEKVTQVEKVPYTEGLSQQYRSKDAGKTCKERFSYSSFDAGATVKKTSPRAKNPTAILVENKDSYMLLECAEENKFFIVQLTDDILVDTVVLANYEFFSSMIRQFRVSVSDRYPVKVEKWTILGTFEARNSRNIQAFLVEHPQIWAKFLRVEILSHYGNEYYCPVSLLRVHGTRILDSLKEADPSDLEGEEDTLQALPEDIEEAEEVIREPQEQVEVRLPTEGENRTIAVGQSNWISYGDGAYLKQLYAQEFTCPPTDPLEPLSEDPITDEQNTTTHGVETPETVIEQPSTVSSRDSASEITTTDSVGNLGESAKNISSAAPSVEAPSSAAENTLEATSISTPSPASKSTQDSAASASSTVAPPAPVKSSVVQNASKNNRSAVPTSIKPPSSRSSTKSPPSGSPGTQRNKTTSTTSSAPPSPTVQDSFFKALTKRLQTLESNTTLSLQYIESQSKFLQEALAKLERRQVAKVDLFLDTLNNTVMGELREVRTQYDQIWQSTVIALETQREQAEREIVALSARLGVLADEVIFQKRMAIVQSVLLLGCLVLVIFSRGFSGGGGSVIDAYYPTQFLGGSSPRFASPTYPSSPSIGLKSPRRSNNNPNLLNGTEGLSPSINSTPLRESNGIRNRGNPKTPDVGNIPAPHQFISSSTTTTLNGTRTPRTPIQQSEQQKIRLAGTATPTSGSRLLQRPQSPNRAISDPLGGGGGGGGGSQPSDYFHHHQQRQEQQPQPPSSVDIGYDSEPATSVNGDHVNTTGVTSGGGGGDGSTYSELLARQAERQLTPSSEVDGLEYSTRSGRPTLLHTASARKPLPALPEDPD